MTLSKTRNGFNLNDCGLKIKFTSYEYQGLQVFLLRRGVLVAIYENKKKFEEQLKSC